MRASLMMSWLNARACRRAELARFIPFDLERARGSCSTGGGACSWWSVGVCVCSDGTTSGGGLPLAMAHMRGGADVPSRRLSPVLEESLRGSSKHRRSVTLQFKFQYLIINLIGFT